MLGQVFSADALAADHRRDRRPRAAAARPRAPRAARVETDPRSPERGQYRFVQSLIRRSPTARSRAATVARGTSPWPATTRASATTSWPGALASHYLAAHEASDEGAEADAVAAQARLALTGAADRAAALGALRPGRRLPRAGARHHHRSGRPRAAPRPCRTLSGRGRARRTPIATRRRPSPRYRELGDEPAALAATARLGQDAHRSRRDASARRRCSRRRCRRRRRSAMSRSWRRRSRTSPAPTCASGASARRSRPRIARWRSPSG